MIGALYFLALLSSTVAWGPADLWSERSASNDTGGRGGDGCTCDAFLPTSTFPVADLVAVEQTVVEISRTLEREMGKLEDYEVRMTEYAEKIVKLTIEVEKMEKDPDAYNEVDFQNTKVEIKQVEALITELQFSINGFATVFESLHVEVAAVVATLNRLEKTYDKNLVLATRREYMKVQLQLEECERRHQEIFNPNIGSCAHTGISKLSQPFGTQLNAYLSTSYIYGGWGKDSKPLPGRESMYWFSGYTSESIYYMKFYSNYKNLTLRNAFQSHSISYDAGTNFIIRDNTLYYQYTNPFGIAKRNFTTMSGQARVIPKASSSVSYAGSSVQNFDFAADETGLWVTYGTEESGGRMVIAKINESSFDIEEEWQTSVYKPSANNAFMICGVLYVTRVADSHTEEIFYKYDTKTKQEAYISIHFERFQDKYSNLDYNPTDQKLYMYNNGYYVSYHLWFNHTATSTVQPPYAVS